MASEPFIGPSAHKHGWKSADILHAYTHPKWVHLEDETGFTMVVGFARDATPLEVGFVKSEAGTPVIIHAMKARPKYMR